MNSFVEKAKRGDFDPLPREATLLMEFPRRIRIRELKRIGESLFVVLEDGQTIDITELLGEAKH